MKDKKSKGENYLSEKMQDKMRYFLQDHSPERVSRNLRKVLIDYLRSQQAGLPLEWDEILNDLESLFDLLDVAAREKRLQ